MKKTMPNNRELLNLCNLTSPTLLYHEDINYQTYLEQTNPEFQSTELTSSLIIAKQESQPSDEHDMVLMTMILINIKLLKCQTSSTISTLENVKQNHFFLIKIYKLHPMSGLFIFLFTHLQFGMFRVDNIIFLPSA